MHKEFWYQKWEDNKIGFHESKANPLLVKYFPKLALNKKERIFVPLCGKSLDIAWLISKGYNVVGVELVELAVEQLFDELGIKPNISTTDNIKHYRAANIDIFVGDIFHLSGDMLGSVDAVYDRAAFVALNDEMRIRYAAHLAEITNSARQFLITFEYDQTVMPGPPFSISNDEVIVYYGNQYKLKLLASENVAGGLKGNAAKEHVWLLQKS